ncbi:putative DNA-binding protein SMUBP-2 [Apostichopus japonicus]|uniref:Putative DNA-binding protein SMUBP-2 n=1 Tax=Stichopus japonicus TaxID=307972 RepID=A0A2G8K3R9_STIJA|nr:putative DNA-binding protein SMUBP-2 [Apostichopus japonicus]
MFVGWNVNLFTRALNDLVKSTNSHSSHLQEVLFGEASLGSPLNFDISDLKFFNSDLDASQQEAVVFALQQREIAIIHGPPGTGKTTTVVEVIRQAVHQGLKVVACAPSNVAVDNLIERLGRSKDINVVRIGHPARLLPEIQRFSLDARLAASDAGKLLIDIRKDIDKILGKASKSKQREDRKSTWNEIKHLRKELREREQLALKMILSEADVVLATNTSISGDGPVHLLPGDHFDLSVVDECAQAVEAGCWIPLRLARKCVLAGDHKQLPPTIISDKASKDGLSISLMERIINLHGDKVVRMLTTQYRMHNDIMSWSSSAMYDDKLRAHSSVASHLLSDLKGVEENDITLLPLLLIDTVGCGYSELELEEEASKGNEGEANLVVLHIERLIESGVRPEDIAVITPYNLQVQLLRQRVSGTYPGVEIKSVDGFQGREKEAVVMSLVRSNSRGEVGFLAEDRRMNVAVTRARRHLCLVCDSQTVSHHPFLKDLVTYMNNHGEVHSGFQYTQEVDDISASHPLPDHLVTNQNVAAQRKTKGEGGVKVSGSKVKVKKLASKSHQTGPPQNKSRLPPEDKAKETEIFHGQQFQQDLKEFVGDPGRKTLRFPSSLSSKDRYVIHDLCTEMKLYHESRGEGSERFIIVSKQPITELSIDHSETSIRGPSVESGIEGEVTVSNDKPEPGEVFTHNSFDIAGFSNGELNADTHMVKITSVGKKGPMMSLQRLRNQTSRKLSMLL